MLQVDTKGMVVCGKGLDSVAVRPDWSAKGVVWVIVGCLLWMGHAQCVNLLPSDGMVLFFMFPIDANYLILPWFDGVKRQPDQ